MGGVGSSNNALIQVKEPSRKRVAIAWAATLSAAVVFNPGVGALVGYYFRKELKKEGPWVLVEAIGCGGHYGRNGLPCPGFDK